MTTMEPQGREQLRHSVHHATQPDARDTKQAQALHGGEPA